MDISMMIIALILIIINWVCLFIFDIIIPTINNIKYIHSIDNLPGNGVITSDDNNIRSYKEVKLEIKLNIFYIIFSISLLLFTIIFFLKVKNG